MDNIVILIFAIVLASAFFSGIEAALFTISSSRAKVFEQQNKPGAKALVKIKENMARPIVVVVIFNNIVNIVGSIFVGVLATGMLGTAWIGAVSAVMTFLIITFGEIIPKTIGEKYAESISLAVARPLLFVIRFFLPVILLLEKFTKRLNVSKKIISEEELRILTHVGHLQGEIEQDERDMIQKVFTLNDITAREIMTPRTVISALEADKTLGEIADHIYGLQNSRLPVYSKNLDTIIGVCNRVDLLVALGKDQKEAKIRDFAQPAIFVSESTKLDDLLPLFQREQYHLAIVRDKFGGTSGTVTLEDVLEQLVGEIVDETDKYVDMRKRAIEKSSHQK